MSRGSRRGGSRTNRSGFTDAERKKLEGAFNQYDADGSGSIDKSELMDVMKACGERPMQKEVDKLIASVDANGDGKIQFDEFLVMVKKVRSGELRVGPGFASALGGPPDLANLKDNTRKWKAAPHPKDGQSAKDAKPEWASKNLDSKVGTSGFIGITKAEMAAKQPRKLGITKAELAARQAREQSERK